MTHPALLLTPALTFWTFGPIKSGGCCDDWRKQTEICLSFKLTWINALLTTASTLVLAVISKYCFDVIEPASPLGYYAILSLPCYAIAMICLLLIQFLNFERSKWLLPMSLVAIVVIFTVICPFSLLTNEGKCFFVELADSSASCFKFNDYCNLEKFSSITPDFASMEVSRPLMAFKMSIYDAALISAAMIAVTLVIACCCTSFCHGCCRKSIESNCFPMTNMIRYDTSSPRIIERQDSQTPFF